uniref:DUF4005 domain-containing protein n=1 Tax=Oryza rufipogon TaxID=4529 RepID=A0A0E0PY82_ORYRU
MRGRRSLRVPPSLPPSCAVVAPTACCPLPPSARQRRRQNPDGIQRLPALKALVKLQALVRGFLVRRQAAATLQSMQALIRAQATVRAHRTGAGAAANLPHLHHAPFWPRRSLQERCAADDTRSEHGVAAYNRRLSTSIESLSYGYDRSPKIVEVDTGRPKSRSSSSRRASSPLLDAGCASGGEEWCANSMSSPLPCYLPGGGAAAPHRRPDVAPLPGLRLVRAGEGPAGDGAEHAALHARAADADQECVQRRLVAAQPPPLPPFRRLCCICRSPCRVVVVTNHGDLAVLVAATVPPTVVRRAERARARRWRGKRARACCPPPHGARRCRYHRPPQERGGPICAERERERERERGKAMPPGMGEAALPPAVSGVGGEASVASGHLRRRWGKGGGERVRGEEEGRKK